MKFARLLFACVFATVVLGVFAFAVVWTTCRVYVPADQCLVLIRKTGAALPPGAVIAEPGQKGIQREALGPGRYFFNPLVWDWKLDDLVMINAGDPNTWQEFYSESASDTAMPELKGGWPEVGIVVSKAGKPAPAGVEVVDEGFQGIQKQVLTPGTYRINRFAYEVKHVPATVVPLGCCGIVTSQLGEMPGVETVEEINVGPDGQPVKGHPKVIQKLAEPGQRGVLRQVLQPGIYYLNPYVYRVQIVQIGYNQISQLATRNPGGTGFSKYSNVGPESDKKKGGKPAAKQPPAPQQQQEAAAATPEVSTHITFPSKDGFVIDIEVTVVWGRHPAHIAEMLNRFGDLEKIKLIILAQMRSICRNLGSDYESTDFIRGEKREKNDGKK